MSFPKLFILHCIVHCQWLDLLKSMYKEAEWQRDKYIPSLDEYMENGYISFALGPIVIPALYLVGPILTEEHIRSSEFHNLFKHMSTLGRLQNDIQGFKVIKQYSC